MAQLLPISTPSPMIDIAEMRDFARLAVCVHRVAEAVAADAGVRMNFAVLAQLAGGTQKNVRMQNAARTDLGAILHDRVRANHAAVCR